MKFKKYWFIILLCLGASYSHATSNQALDAKITTTMKQFKVPGLSIVVVKNGDIAYVKCFGVKNNLTKDAVTNDTLFEAASLSKPLFSYGVLKMVENGLLDLDVPLSNYIEYSDLKNNKGLITARNILSHTSGLPNWRNEKELKTYFKPGDRFSYSGEGYVYLQKVIEKLSGLSLEEYMQKMVFKPLGMTHSSYVWKDSLGYACGHNSVVKCMESKKNYLGNAAFSMQTTALDYVKFLQAINKAMLKEQVKVSIDGPFCINKCSDALSKNVSWGLGIGLQKIKDKVLFWHWGDNPGFKSYVSGSENGDAIIIFTNSDNGMKAIQAIVNEIDGKHPALQWLNYN